MRVVVTLALVCVLATACGDEAPVDTAATGPGATEACGPVETIPVQGEGHLVGDREPPVPYNSTPPTSGWHSSGDVPFTVYGPDDPLTEPEQVTVLELEGVVISYNGLAEEDVAELGDLVSGEYAGKAALTPYDKLGEGEIALTAWGKVQVCDAVDPKAIAAFIAANAVPAG